MHNSDKQSRLKDILLTLKEWSLHALHGHYRWRHRVHGRPDEYKNIDRDTIRRPPRLDNDEELTMTRDEAEAELQAALAAQNEAQAAVLEAQARVMMARAMLMRLGPLDVTLEAPQSLSHDGLMEACLSVIRRAGRPLTVDEVLAGLEADAITLDGKDPRANLQAYLSRWPTIHRPRRGLYAAK